MSEREGEEEEEEEEGRRVFDHDGGSLQTWGPPASQDRQKNLLQNKREKRSGGKTRQVHRGRDFIKRHQIYLHLTIRCRAVNTSRRI